MPLGKIPPEGIDEKAAVFPLREEKDSGIDEDNGYRDSRKNR